MALAIECVCDAKSIYDVRPGTSPDILDEFVAHALLVDTLQLVDREKYPELYRQAVDISERGGVTDDFLDAYLEALGEISDQIPNYAEYDDHLKERYEGRRASINRIVAIILKPEKFTAWSG